MTALLRPEEVAVRLGVSRWTVYDLARRGVLPVVRIGRTVRFDPESLARFVQVGGCGLGAAGAQGDEHRTLSPGAPRNSPNQNKTLEGVGQKFASSEALMDGGTRDAG